MYAVVGTDGVVYGPVDYPTLMQWVAQGRIVPATVLIDRNGRQLPASMAPELVGTFPMQMQPYGQPLAYGPPPKKKSTALWLAIILGGFGVHRFYLGHNGTGVAMLVLCIFTCGIGSTIWSLVDAALIASGGLIEANGRPLA